MFNNKEPERQMLERYPRIIGHLICESLGYFTPQGAAVAVYKYKQGDYMSCELYSDVCYKRGKGFFDEEELKKITKEFLEDSIRNRRFHKGYMADYNLAKEVIKRELEGQGPDLASWF